MAGSRTCGWTTRELAERLLADQRLLRLPLVRFGDELTAGRAEADVDRLAQASGRRRAAVTPSPTTDEHEDRARGRPAHVAVHEPAALQQAEPLGDPHEPDDDEHGRDDQPSAHDASP